MISGPSGSGKSDLALRLIDRGAVLVSDDYTLVIRNDAALMARAPDTILGKMEVRGIGIIEMNCATDVPVALCVELFPTVDRMPAAPMLRSMAGVKIPVMKIAPTECSAPIKVELALKAFGLEEA